MGSIIVSLTSHPKRINVVDKVIESLWKQTASADEIILYLSLEEFPQKEKNLPVILTEMIGKNGFTIEWVEGNLKSHKKYFYVMQSKADCDIITVDDDVIYSETLISDLVSCYKKYPYAVSARKARIIVKDGKRLAKYKDWDGSIDEYADSPRIDLCAIGVGGVFYPAGCTSDRWFDKKDILFTSENQDDLWLKYNEIIDGIPVVYVKPTQDDFLIENVQDIGLSKKNIYENDDSVIKLSFWMKTNYPDIYSRWISDIIQRNDYIMKKKAFYKKSVKKVFDNIGDMPVYMFGAGKRAKAILNILSEFKMIGKLEAIIVSDKKANPDILKTIPIIQIDELDKEKKFAVIYGIGKMLKKEVDNILRDYNCKCFDLHIDGLIQYFQ